MGSFADHVASNIATTGSINDKQIALAALIHTGTGSPEGSRTAPVGSLYIRTDGGTSTTLYIKESGSGNTGWVGSGAVDLTAITKALASDDVLNSKVTGDAQPRFNLNANGSINWGPGNAAMDVSLSRSDVATLELTGAFLVNGLLTAFSGMTTDGGPITMTDADNIVFGTVTGTKIGTAVGQKFAFHNATPVAQRAGAEQAAIPAGAATNVTPFGFTENQANAIIALGNEMRAVLVEKGLMKGSA